MSQQRAESQTRGREVILPVLRSARHRSGFTLVELLVAIAVIALLLAIAIPATAWATAALANALRADPGSETAHAQILLWPNGAPGAVGDEPADKPSLTIYQPAKQTANGCAVVVCPGGGYGHLAVGHEGKDVAEWFNSFGVTAFVLRYRIAPRYHHPAPMQDVQRALRTVRSRADEWGVDPHRIGVIGFSAGGHLASTAGTHFDNGDAHAADPVEQVSCRPDFLILAYPVISFTTPYTHKGSMRNLLGEHPDPELVAKFSNEKQVTQHTPPTFLVHSSGDTGVPAENSVLFYLALRRAGVPAEMHIYEQGKHGFGLAPNDPVLSSWPERCRDWLRVRGVLKPTQSHGN